MKTKWFIKRDDDRELIPDSGATVEAETLDEAVGLWMVATNHPASHLVKHEDGHYSWWGCSLRCSKISVEGKDKIKCRRIPIYINCTEEQFVEFKARVKLLIEAFNNDPQRP